MTVFLSETIKALPVAIITGVIAELVTVLILRIINKGEPLKTVTPIIWITGIIRTSGIVLYFIILFYFFNEKWSTVSTKTVLITVTSILLIIAIGSIPKFLPIFGKRKKTDYGHFIKIIYLLIGLALCVWILDRLLPHYVSINCQGNVGTTCTIKGHVIKSNRYVRVLVRAASDNTWYTQQTPVIDEKGNWESVCVFRGQEGQVYKILALASSDSISLQQDDQIISEQIPKNVRLSKVCTTKIK